MEDEERLKLREAQFLPWIANPLHHFFRFLDQEERLLDRLRPGLFITERRVEDAEEDKEASLIELFYDLFIVADLTTVTGTNEINSERKLASYVLYFIIIWFTWLQTTLYDVRFSVDSVYERVCKVVHFGVLVGFASVSTEWNPFDPDSETVTALKQLTIVLLISRAMLGLQYMIVMAYAWKKTTTPAVPLAIHSGTMFISAFVYLGLYFAFQPIATNRAYVGWYVMIIFEAVVVIVTSCTWRVVSFKRTHLVERMGLLTLIVLGEGIIVMLKAVNTIVSATNWFREAVGIVVAAIAIIYFFWMFYFDYTPRNVHYGSIRQAIWAFLHFPFHLFLVLAVEGLRQLSIWWSFVTGVSYVLNIFNSVDISEAVPMLKDYLEELYEDGTSKTVLKNYKELMDDLDELEDSDRSNATEWNKLVNEIGNGVFTGLAEFYKIETEEVEVAPDVEAEPEFNEPLREVGELYTLVYHYFYGALGAIFIMFALFAILVRRHKDKYDWVAILFRFITAIVFFGIAGMYRTGLDEGQTLLMSPWPIPLVCLIMFVVLILDKLLAFVAYHNLRHKIEERGEYREPKNSRPVHGGENLVPVPV